MTIFRITQLIKENENNYVFYYDTDELDINEEKAGIFSIDKKYFDLLSKIEDRIDLLNCIMLGFIDKNFILSKLHSKSIKEEGMLDEDAILCLEDIIGSFNTNKTFPKNTFVITKKGIELINNHKKNIVRNSTLTEEQIDDFINSSILKKKVH